MHPDTTPQVDAARVACTLAIDAARVARALVKSMTVKLLLFASYTDIAGASELTVTLPNPSTVDDAARWLVNRFPKFAEVLPKGRVAVNLDFVDSSHPLAESDEVAFMPPMSGG